MHIKHFCFMNASQFYDKKQAIASTNFNRQKKKNNPTGLLLNLHPQIVNGERASYAAPKFARMQERTRSQMLEDLVANLQNHAETGQIPKPYR